VSSMATPRVHLSELTCEEIHGGVCKAESDGGIVILLQLRQRQAVATVINSGRGVPCPSSARDWPLTTMEEVAAGQRGALSQTALMVSWEMAVRCGARLTVSACGLSFIGPPLPLGFVDGMHQSELAMAE
jgi:hypothetical protein